MSYCTSCGHAVQDDWRFCSECGAAVESAGDVQADEVPLGLTSGAAPQRSPASRLLPLIIALILVGVGVVAFGLIADSAGGDPEGLGVLGAFGAGIVLA